MKEDNKTKKQLINELTALRLQHAALNQSITGSTLAELAVEEARRYAENIVETVRGPLLVLDADLKIISANRNFFKTFEVTPGETIGNFIYDLGNKQWDIPKLRELLETILPEKATFDNYEVEHDFATIGRRTMLLNARQIQRMLGKERIILLAIEDITESKEIEAGLEKTRKELAATKISEDAAREYAESIINTVREPLIALDQDLRVVSVSRSFYEVFKVNPEDTVGQLIYDLGNKQWDIPKLRELLETIFPGKATFDNYEVEHDFATIGRRTMLLNARQIEQVLGKEKIILLAIEDITERRQTENELMRAKEEAFRSIFDNAGDGILLADIGSKKFYLGNRSICQMLGYSTEEIKDLGVMDIHPEKDIPYAIDHFERMAKGESSLFQDLPLKRKDGMVLYADVSGTIVTVGDKQYLMGFFHDITERKRAEENLLKTLEELRESKDMLVQSEKLAAVGYLSAGVAHEILNPINIISMRLQLLEALGDMPDHFFDTLRICQEQIDRIVKITKDLNEFSRIAAAEYFLADLNELIKHIMEMTAPRFKVDKVNASLNLSEDLPAVSIDKSRIEQVLLNLINNAIDAMEGKEKKILSITSSKEETREGKAVIRIAIADNGTGVKDEAINKIFDPFYTTKVVGNGTGLGLSITHGIVQDHKGRIWVENNELGGATFIVELPLGKQG
jgi:PAS domain S-box-containing protein